MLKVALYDPYLDTLGGGEKHILSILKALNENDYEINLFWDKNLTKAIEQKFSLQCLKTSKWLPNIFSKHTGLKDTLKTLQTLRTFDYFFYVTDGSYFFSSAKKNFVFCMVPQKNLYQMNLINRIKTLNFRFITNSFFTKKWLEKWGIKNKVVYPYINEKFIKINPLKKENVILSVGRFFPHLHSKQHKVIIETFKKLRRSSPNFKSFRLILAGSLKDEDKEYFNDLKKLTTDDPSITFKPNLDFDKLYELYKLSRFFWHFTGFGVDEEKHPEMVEHLGITPLEAMAAGCITFCYNAGGPKEIIKDGETGFLFNNEEELIQKTLFVLNNDTLQQNIIFSAKKFIKENFSYSIFKERVKKIILEL